MKICLFTPSSPSPEKDLKRGLAILKDELAAQCPDLEIRDKALIDMSRANPDFDYVSSTDREKAMVFQTLTGDSSCNFILCSRGGYGALRWLHMVGWDSAAAWRPRVVGFSDVTVILSAILRAGGSCIHGPMLNTLSNTAGAARQALWKVLIKGELPAIEGVAVKNGDYQGVLVGGNFTSLCHLIGTPFEPDWQDKILFLEDCNEPAYRLDRMLTHMKLAGVFDRIGGLALGQFTDKDRRGTALPLRLLQDRLSGFTFPVISDLPVGHGRMNMPLGLGASYRISGKTAFLTPLL